MQLASITIMIGGAIVNAASFIDSNYFTPYLSSNGKATLEEKEWHDKALEVYQAAYAKYMHDRAKLVDWIATNTEIKEQTRQNSTDTDYAF